VFVSARRPSRFPESLLHRNIRQCLDHIFIPPLKPTLLQPSNTPGVEGEDTQAGGETADRETAMEDCSRLAIEAEQSLPIARTIGEALAVLNITVLMTNSSSSSQVAATVSSEVASAVVEAEELVDDLLKVIQVSSTGFSHKRRLQKWTISNDRFFGILQAFELLESLSRIPSAEFEATICDSILGRPLKMYVEVEQSLINSLKSLNSLTGRTRADYALQGRPPFSLRSSKRPRVLLIAVLRQWRQVAARPGRTMPSRKMAG